MRLNLLAALVSGIAAAAIGLASLPADAAPKKAGAAVHRGYSSYASQPHRKRVRQARARTRIIVRHRSYLDPGTEVLPGDEKYTDYAVPPTYSATSVIDNTPFSHRSPLPGPFDLPGRNNPMQW